MNNYYSLITGASQGLGKMLAIECARLRMNLVLVSLPGIELHYLAEMLRNRFGISVVCIEKDLCQDHSCLEVFNEISALGLKVNMLFNNAGVGGGESFSQSSCQVYEEQIKLNVLATTIMTKHFIDMLKANSPSYILNVGSLASFFSIPSKEVYGATKSYIYYFSKGLRKELYKDRVYVSILCPGGMNTNARIALMIKKANFFMRLSCMEPENVVPAAIRGLLRKKAVIIPGKLNQIFIIMDVLLPGFIKNMFFKQTIPVRKRGATIYRLDSTSSDATVMV